jgi:UDP-glucose 4-epimerase
MRRAWVIGSGGMLGSAIRRALDRQGRPVYRHPEPFAWNDPDRIGGQLAAAARAFLDSLSAGDDWQLYWAAGRGSMGSTPTELETETRVLGGLLEALRDALRQRPTPGRIGYASSAGAIYSRCPDFEVTLGSAVTPETDYARAKLAQEALLSAFASEVEGVEVLLARFSTLYGPGQAQGKPQGLLSKMARSAVRNQPVEIIVPLDTARDYLFVDDAAEDLTASLDAFRQTEGRVRIRIISNERSVTISQIIAAFNTVAKKRLRYVHARNRISALYLPRIAFAPSPDRPQGTRRRTLLEGVDALLQSEMRAYLGPR